MGENKEKTVKTVEEQKKPTYEQLKNWCDQLMMQRNQLAEKLDQATSVMNILPWLFKVVENKDSFTSEFVDACTKEIMLIMEPPVEESKSNNKD